MNKKKEYIIVKDRYPHVSEVLWDCRAELCVSAKKNEPLSSILQKLCSKISSNFTNLQNQIEELEGEIAEVPVYLVEEGTGIEITGTGSEDDPWIISSSIVDTNFATSNLTATATRTHNWGNFAMVINQLSALEITGPTSAAGAVSIYPRATSGDMSFQTLAQFSAASATTMSNGNSSTSIVAFRDSCGMNPSGGSGNISSFAFEGTMNHSGSYSGTTRGFRANPTALNSIAPYIAFDSQGSWFSHSGSSFRGFYHHPNITGSFSGTHIAWENTLGDVLFNTGANGGRAGFRGVTTPTAWVHIGAGTAGANSAPLKLTAGTNLTSPENGAFEFDGTNLYFTVGGVRKTVTLV